MTLDTFIVRKVRPLSAQQWRHETGTDSTQKRQRSPSPHDSEIEEIPAPGVGIQEVGGGPLTIDGDLAALDQEMAPPVADLTEDRTPDIAIEDMNHTIDSLADKLAALCIEQFSQNLNSGGHSGNDNMDVDIDQDSEAFREELRVGDSKAIRK